MDILIQAPSDSSGSLIRLLKSIENADYFGARRPHLTIELPTTIDPPTWRYLENLVWPPLDWSGSPHASQVSLRHRIPRRTSTEHEASARLIESFYPVRTGNSHVLLLSPQVELSPLYYHYVIYNLLEYKYSAYGAATTAFPNLVGFSLELPSFHLNDSEPLKPPLLEKTPLKGKEKGLPGERTPFLWQAPNGNAALYFGDKWMEFHSFLSARLTKPPSSRRKVFSQKHPAWIEFLLELIRARGYSMLYPNFPNDGDAIATIHDELYQIPEEYHKSPETPPSPTPNLDPDDPLTADNEQRPGASPPNIEQQLLESSLISILPNNGDLPEMSNLPLLSYNGINMSGKLSHEAAMSFSETFRREIGTCTTDAETTPRAVNSALDLFCHLDDIYDPLHPVQPQYSRPPRPVVQPHDEDAIASEHHDNAKQESSAHMARQKAQTGPIIQPLSIPPSNLPPHDDSSETQTEFKSQMQRQAKQVGSNADPASAPAAPPEPATHESHDLPKQEAPLAPPPPAIPAADSLPPPESPAKPDPPTAQPPAQQDPETSTKQPPRAIEDPTAEAAQEKGSGW